MSRDSADPLPLEEVEGRPATAASDIRPRMPEALPVRLLTVEDARLIAAAGTEKELDAFYVAMLCFQRQPAASGLVYRAENYRLLFALVDSPIVRNDMRILGVEVPSLRRTERKLIDAGIEFSRQKALNPGKESLLCQDPAGNWIELTGFSLIR